MLRTSALLPEFLELMVDYLRLGKFYVSRQGFMHKLIPNNLTCLLILSLSLAVTAKTVEAETDPLATDKVTSITSFHTERLKDGQIGRSRAKNGSNRVVAESIPFQTLPLSPQIPSSQTTHRCNLSWSPLQPNPSTCIHTQLEQVPRTLKEAGFSNQPIFAAPNPISQTTAPQTPATPPDTPTPNLRISPRVGGSFTTGPGVGYESSFGGLEGFVPLSQKPGQNLAFLQGRALLSTENARLGGNAIIGYRTYSSQNNRTLGGYVGYDIRDTGNSTFNQVGLGLESLGNSTDFRANGYIPVGNTRHKIGESSFSHSSFTPQVPNFQGNYLAIGTLNQLTQVNRRFEAAMSGFDAEAGVKIARLGETGALRGYGGLYYYNALGTAGIVGIRGRIEGRATDNFRVGLSVQSDGKFGTNVVLSVATNFPDSRPKGTRRQDEVVARLGEGVTRQENIVVDQQRESQVNSTTSAVVATNPATNQPYLFQHVNLGGTGGNGTFENPFGIVQNALNATRSDGNDIVYVQPGTNPGIPAFKIPDKVQVLSTGPVQVIPTVQLGNVQLPLSGAGVLPKILPSDRVNVPGVTMGNSTVLSGFAINNATDVGIGNEGSAGTGLNPISNVTIRDNQIVDSGAAGIQLTNVTGAINLFNNTITSSGVLPAGGDGIQITNTGGQANVTITGNNQITENNGRGISFLLENNAQVTSTISGNTISGNAFDGISFDLNANSSNSAQVNNVKISENTISGNGTRANGSNGNGITFSFNNNASANNVTISQNQISNNNGAGIGLGLENNAQATATISGNTISGNIFYAASLGNGKVTSAGNGIVAVTYDNSTLRLLIDSNLNISNNQSNGIFLQAAGGSNIFATVSNNTLTNNHTNPAASSFYNGTGNFVAQSIGNSGAVKSPFNNSKVCLNLANNTSIAPNPRGADFNFFIGNNTLAQFIYSASGNTPATINYSFFSSSNPLAPPSLFTTPLGSCPVP